MRTLLSVLLLSLFLTFMQGCSNCRCVDGTLGFSFKGYQPSDLSIITLKRYAKETGFNQLLDSTRFFIDTDFRLRQQDDILRFGIRPGNMLLAPNADWEIVLPSAARTIRIQDIKSPQVKDDCSGKVQCVNPILSALVNGVIVHLTPGNPDILLSK